MLEDQVAKGNGDVKVFEGMSWYDDSGNPYTAETTISKILADTDVMSESSKAAAKVDTQFEILKKEIGIADADVEASIVRVPFLHWSVSGYSIAYQPGTVNDLYPADTHIAVPEPHGPIINGKDIFKTQLEDALKPHGITVEWVEDWDLYHAMEGEVHCGSNSMRQIPTVKWWETGR
jgi:protein-arginine deiminase